MARGINGRPPLREALQKFDATRADELLGVKTQDVPNASAVADVVGDREANLHISRESTNAFAFTGIDLSDEATPAIQRTFKRAAGATQVVTVTLAQLIDGNTSYTLDTAGSAITVAPVVGAGADTAWELVSALGTVTAVP